MSSLKFILAKHGDELAGVRCRGSGFMVGTVKRIVEMREGRKIQLLNEDIFTGFTPSQCLVDIRTNRKMQDRLKVETKQYLEIVREIQTALNKGQPPPESYGNEFSEIAIESNRAEAGTITYRSFAYTFGMQIETIAASALKNEGYLLAYQYGQVDEAVDILLRSLYELSKVVKRRDAVVAEQIRAIKRTHPEDIIVVTEGSNHSYFAAELEREMGAEVHRQPDDVFSYYDEALNGHLEGKMGEPELRRLMRLEPELNFMIMAGLSFAPQLFAEEHIRLARAAIEQKI